MMLLTLILLSLSCFPSEHKKLYDQFCAPIFVLAAWLTSYQGATAVESILYAGKFLSLSFVPLSLFFSLSSLSPSLICLLPPSLLLFVYLHPLHVSSLLDSSPLSLLPPPPTLSLSLSLLFLGPLSPLCLPTLSYFLFISTPCMCPLCLILLYIIPSTPPTLSFSHCSP